MAEIFDLTADSGDEQPCTRTDSPIDLTKESDDEQPPAKRARPDETAAAEAATGAAARQPVAPASEAAGAAARQPVAPVSDGRIKIVAWNASSILPKTGKNRDKLARLVQRLGRVDAFVIAECTIKRGEEAAARARQHQAGTKGARRTRH